MLSTSKIDNDAIKKYIKIDFGTVPVGSIHKRPIDITNYLKKTTKFQVKNNNESMYLADSISFEPSITPRIFPNKKTRFLITFSPKSTYVRTTLEYFTIFSIDDESEEVIFNENDEPSGEILQKVTICVQGSCYGPSVTIFPTEVFLHPQFEGKKQGQNTSKLVNLVNKSKMPGKYLVQYDCVNSPLICHPSTGLIENRVQIKLDLNTRHVGYYYKRLYILILNHHPVYVDVYAFSGKVPTAVDPFSYFRTPFELPKYENNYADFFKDVAHPSLPEQQLVMFPSELQFGYTKSMKTLSFEIQNNSDTLLYVNWIHVVDCGNNPFTINLKRFYIESHETKKMKCTFQPKIISNIYFAEFEATVHFSSNLSPPQALDHNATFTILPKYVAPMNISITATGHSFKKPFNGWKPKCKLNTHIIVMPPSVPDSKPVFATLFIKKVVLVPTTFEFRPPDRSMFLVKPKCGLINGDYQIIVFQLLKTNNKESLYAERWNIVFDGFENNSISIDIYASVEFGCITIGEKNCIFLPDNVQVDCEMNTQIPIVNTTRHRLNYYINLYDQYPKTDIKSSSSLYSGYEELESVEMDETEYRHTSSSEFQEDTNTDIEEHEDNKSTSSNNSRIMSIDSTQTPVRVLKNPNLKKTPDPSQWPFVFKFNKFTGELEPNEKYYLTLSFCPLKSVLYTADAKCYLMCNDFTEIVNILPVVIKGSGCNTLFKITPVNCFLNNTVVNMERTQRFIIENTNCSYANIRIDLMPACSKIFWSMPSCKINPETFHFTPQQNQCKLDLSIHPTELGLQKFFIKIQIKCSEQSYLEYENIITIDMNVIMCALQISRITNDSIPYFGKLALNKLFHCIKINNELSKVYIKNKSPLIWIIPVISEPTVFEFQFYNLSKIPISWALKYNNCNKCTTEKNNNYSKNIGNKNYSNLSNKCIHYKSIQISPSVNIKMEDFSKFKIELNNVNKDRVNLSYIWSSGPYKSSIYNTELLIEPIMSKDDFISFDPKYGTNGHLEFNFIPIFIAHPNPPAQAFWMYNNNICNVKYSIIEDSLTPAYPYFHCLNPSGIVNSKSVHPILYVFSPNKLCKFEATVFLLSNNNKRQITLLGQGESYIRTPIWLEPGMSSLLPIKNGKQIFLSTESIILKPMFTCSKIKSMFCLYNDDDEEIMYEWKECTIAKILTGTVIPNKGNLRGHSSQVFEITVTSYYRPAIFTIVLNISYKLVSQIENYKQSLKNYNNIKDKLDGIFIINACGNYIPKLIMKLENQPEEKHLVLYVFVKIIDEFNNKGIYETKNNMKSDYNSEQEEQTILKQKIQNSNKFKNILWSIMDKMCSKEIESKLYYHQLKKYKKKIPNEISKITKNNLEFILTAIIKDSLINIYPSKMWKS